MLFVAISGVIRYHNRAVFLQDGQATAAGFYAAV